MSTTVALDSGAVIALARGDRAVMALLRYYRDAGAFFIIPVPVLAETLRGGRADASVNRILNTMKLVVLDAEAARDAGRRLGATKSKATVDALIVAAALRGGATDVLTSDPDDLSRLADGELHVVRTH